MSKRPAEDYLASPGHVHRQRLNSTPPTGLSLAPVPPPSTTSAGTYPTISCSTNHPNTPSAGGLSPHVDASAGANTGPPVSIDHHHPGPNPTSGGHVGDISGGGRRGGIIAINSGGYQMSGGGSMSQQPMQQHTPSGGPGYAMATLPTQQRTSPTPTPTQALQQRASPSVSPVAGRPAPLLTQNTPDVTARKAKQSTPTTDPVIYSDTVRKGISNHSRTGQACDRCKVRKIRCDQAPDQCTNCRNQNLECLVTDRTTGRTVRRDYLTELEKRMTALENSNKGLTQLLRAHAGIEARPFEYNPIKAKLPAGHTVDDQGNIIPDPEWQTAGWTEECGIYVRRAADAPSPAQAQSYSQSQAPTLTPPPAPAAHQVMLSRTSANTSERPSPDPSSKPFRLASDLETVRRPGLHLGVMPDAIENRSAVMGTHLAVLGFAFNLTDDSDPDVAEPDVVADPNAPPIYNKSVRSMQRSIYHLHPVPELDLPSYETTSSYSQWYFLMIHPFLPIIHKTSYSAMLKNFYEPGFVPKAWQIVQVHMVLAIIYYQIGTRNWEKPAERDTFVDLSNKHYHIALSKVSRLQMEPSFEAVQSLTLISSHVRSFPKPGAALHISYKAFNMAIEISLHRATHPMSGKTTNLHLEMRKRVWWSILVVIVTLCGRLGKPMPISGAEFDVPFPEAIPEECLLEDGVDMSLKREPCHYLVGLAGYRIVPLYLEMYANLYAVKFDAARYSDIVAALEAKLDAWRKWVPKEIRVGVPGPAEEEGKVLATYTHLFGLEFRLCLRHPAVNEASSEEVKSTNIKICRELCRDIYLYTSRLSDLKSLDTTFYQASIYLLCLMTVLSAVHKERHTLNHQEHAEFREEVEGWLRILQEVWKLIGVNDASLRPLIHLVKSGLDDTPQKPPMDEAALFRHVLQDILDRRKEPKAVTPSAQYAADPMRHGRQAQRQEHHLVGSQVHVQYQNGDMSQAPDSAFNADNVDNGATMLDLAMSAEQLAAVGMSDGISWFPVPPGYVREPNGIIMPMENIPNNAFSPSLPAVPDHLSGMAGGSGANIPVSHASSGWPLLIFEKSMNTPQQGANQMDSRNAAANYGQAASAGAVYEG